MHRSVFLLLMPALLLSVAVALPLSLEESAEKSWLDLLLEDSWESDELLDFSHKNDIHKRAAKDSSSSSEEHKDKAKDKANSSGASSSEEQKTTTDQVAEESTTQAAARRRRSSVGEVLEACKDPKRTISGLDPFGMRIIREDLCPQLKRILWDQPNSDTIEDPMSAGSAIHKRTPKDPSSSSEEHKDKAKNSSGESSSEEQKSTTQAPVRRRRSGGPEEQQRINKASGELELDAQAEKELDEEMARAVADVKDNGSIEDYAQGCEVMEVSSKEANEATYAE